MTTDIISRTVRGKMLRIAGWLTEQEQIDFWHCAGYPVMELREPLDFNDESRRIFRTFSGATDWTDAVEVKKGMTAFSLISQRAHFNSNNDFDFMAETDGLDEELRKCGYTLEMDGRIIPLDGVGADDLNLKILQNPAGVRADLERLNRSVAADDPGDTVAKAKALMESVAKAIIDEFDPGWKLSGNKSIFDQRTRQAMRVLGIKMSEHDKESLDSLVYLQCDRARQIALNANKVRNLKGGDHGDNYRVKVDHVHAQLAVDAVTLWCRYLISMAGVRKMVSASEPPF